MTEDLERQVQDIDQSYSLCFLVYVVENEYVKNGNLIGNFLCFLRLQVDEKKSGPNFKLEGDLDQLISKHVEFLSLKDTDEE